MASVHEEQPKLKNLPGLHLCFLRHSIKTAFITCFILALPECQSIFFLTRFYTVKGRVITVSCGNQIKSYLTQQSKCFTISKKRKSFACLSIFLLGCPFLAVSCAQGPRRTLAARLKWILTRIVAIRRWVVTIATQWRPDDQKEGLSRQAPPPVEAPPLPWVLELKDRPQHRYKHTNILLNVTLHVLFSLLECH